MNDNSRIQARVSQLPVTPQSPMTGQTTPMQMHTPMQTTPMQMPIQTTPMQTPMYTQMPTQTVPMQPYMQSPMPGALTQQGPPPVASHEYVPGYLSGLIGKNIRAEFIVGTNSFIDKTGVLVEVGVNFFVLRDTNFHVNVMCDLYSVKFVTVLS